MSSDHKYLDKHSHLESVLEFDKLGLKIVYGWALPRKVKKIVEMSGYRI